MDRTNGAAHGMVVLKEKSNLKAWRFGELTVEASG